MGFDEREIAEREPGLRQLINVGGEARAAKRRRRAKAHIIQKNPNYIRSASGRFDGFRPPFFGLGEGPANHSLIRLRLLSLQCELRTQCQQEYRYQLPQYMFPVHKAPFVFRHSAMT